MNIDFLKDVALAVAQEQDLETVMKMTVGGINEEPAVDFRRFLYTFGECTRGLANAERPSEPSDVSFLSDCSALARL
jgi:hypothetical protein